jgi:hypothetical protein
MALDSAVGCYMSDLNDSTRSDALPDGGAFELDFELLCHSNSIDQLLQVRKTNQEHINQFVAFKNSLELACSVSDEQHSAIRMNRSGDPELSPIRGSSNNNNNNINQAVPLVCSSDIYNTKQLSIAKARADNLHAHVLERDGYRQWRSWQLLRVLSLFEALGAYQYIVELYESSHDRRLAQITRAREAYATGLFHVGRVADAIHELTEMRISLPKDAHRQTSLLLGDCYVQQARVAEETASYLQQVKSGEALDIQALDSMLQTYRKHFESSHHCDTPISISLSTVTANVKLASAQARKEFLRHSTLDCHFDPILRVIDSKVCAHTSIDFG